MKKLNNKGFAISTALYGLLLVITIFVAISLQILRVENNINDELGKSINEKLNNERAKRICVYKGGTEGACS